MRTLADSHSLNTLLISISHILFRPLLSPGDTHSLGVLVARWERPLYRFVYRMLPRQEDARDVCQETFLRVLRKAHRFRRGSRFSTWLYQIALNLCRDQARRRKRWSRVVDEGGDVEGRLERMSKHGSTGADPSSGVEQRERHEAVAHALRQIPAEQREVLAALE